jgi:hypothetical protein
MAYFDEDYIGTPAAKPLAHTFINGAARLPFRRDRLFSPFGRYSLI